MPLAQHEYKEKLLRLIADLNNKFIERDELARILVLTVFCKQHIFLIGEPGVGKTDIANTIASMIKNTNFWEKVLDHDTKKHELFGDPKIPYSELNKFETILGNEFVFLDEMFKAPSESLNACLPIMNERIYQDKGRKHTVPLLAMFGASNEMPSGDKIAPFDDRLIFRYDVLRIQKDENFLKFIKKQFDTSRVLNVQFEIDDLHFVEAEAKKLKIDDSFFESFTELKKKIVGSGIKMSDRKFGKAESIIRTAAYLNNRTQMDYSDFFILNHIAWAKIEEKKRIRRITYQFCYGSKEEIDSIYIKADKERKKLDGEIRSELADYLNYNFTQKDFCANIEYKFDVISSTMINSFSDELQRIALYYYEIKSRKEFADMVTAQIKDNIFVVGIVDRTFTQEVCDVYIENISELQGVHQRINTWVANNPDYFSFQKNCLSKNRGIYEL